MKEAEPRSQSSNSQSRPRILAIIPARGGSKGLPGKNIKSIADKPLIAWSIEQALASHSITRTIVSTDNAEIADIATSYAADVPFLRPETLAHDESPTADAVVHAIETLADQGENYDIVMVLEPTSPLRRSSDIDRVVNALIENNAFSSAITVGEIHTEHPLITKKIVDGHVLPYFDAEYEIHQRQQTDKSYFPYGVVYASRVAPFLKGKTFYTPTTLPVYIERWQNYEIDDELDFFLVEKLLYRYMDLLIDTQ